MKKRKTSRSRLYEWLRTHKLLSVAIFIILFICGFATYIIYDNHQNRQLMISLDEDMKYLREDLSAELGADVEYKTDCYRTHEVWGPGPFGCTLSLEYKQHVSSSAILDYISGFSQNFHTPSKFTYSNGYYFDYKGYKKRCTLQTYKDDNGFLFECGFFVNDSNMSLAYDLFIY